MLRDRGQVGELPETVQGLIAARLDLLGNDQKALLQDAAVIGKQFWTGAAAALAERPDLEGALHELERKEFVRRERSSSVVDETEYSFRHLLVRDVAYAQIPRADRAAKHLAAAGWLEQLGRREDHAEMLAHHYLQALELTTAAGGSTSSFADAAQAALADAGDRAFALFAYDTAIRFFRGALDLLPDGDRRRGPLLLRLGNASYDVDQPAAELLQAARDELLASGDVELAAEAEAMLCDNFWIRVGDRDEAMRHLVEARRLVEPLPTSKAKASVMSSASRWLMLAGEDEESIRIGEQALAMAEELGLDAIKANTLINVGSSRSALGDEEGIELMKRGIEVARAANVPFDVSRGLGNLASWLWVLGDLSASMPLWREAERIAEEYGQLGFVRWFRGVTAESEYELGLWDTTLQRANAFLAEVEAGSPHYLAGECYFARALVRFGRGDDDGALSDAANALATTERAKDPQARYPAAAAAAYIYVQLGDHERAGPPAEEFLDAARGDLGLGFATSALHVLSFALTPLGRGAELAEALGRLGDNPWARAATAFARDDPLGAAEILGGFGAINSEAYCRLVAARAGDLAQLEPALAFYRSVGATRYVREGEALLPASA
jgi:hypothetical protein